MTKTLAAFALGALFALSAAAAFGAAPPDGKTRGPIPITDASRPYLQAGRTDPPVDVAAKGYLEEEYFLAGTANIYGHDRYGNIVVTRPSLPYVTRILVRRPKDAAKFSGSAYVEVLNPSSGADTAPFWNYAHDHFMAHGDAWVGITSKPATIGGLKAFDAARYADLYWPTTACKAGDVAKADNGALWDMLTQLAGRLRDGGRVLGGKASRVYLLGKSAGDAPAYMIFIHPMASAALGHPAFDGYVINSSFGSGPLPLSACEGKGGWPHTVSPIGVPILNIQTETDVVSIGGGWQNRRADGDDANDMYRLYEVPGASHIDAEIAVAANQADQTAAGARSETSDTCAVTAPLNPYPLHDVVDAALMNLEAWSRDGVPAPKAPRLSLTIAGDPLRATTVKDANGEAAGGLRMPAIDAPVARYVGYKDGPGACRYTGYAVAFDHDTLAKLYPTHADYVAKTDAAVDAAVAGHWLTLEDAADIKAKAAAAAVP